MLKMTWSTFGLDIILQLCCFSTQVIVRAATLALKINTIALPQSQNTHTALNIFSITATLIINPRYSTSSLPEALWTEDERTPVSPASHAQTASSHQMRDLVLWSWQPFLLGPRALWTTWFSGNIDSLTTVQIHVSKLFVLIFWGCGHCNGQLFKAVITQLLFAQCLKQFEQTEQKDAYSTS